MFSLIFFLIVGVVLVAGMIATALRKHKKGLRRTTTDADANENLSGENGLSPRSANPFTEAPAANRTGGMMPAGNTNAGAGFENGNTTNTNDSADKPLAE
jgi:hypothetical protein